MNVNILDFGAVGDGVFDNTEAINNAVKHCAQSGGGKVIVPAGIFVSGSIVLKSHVYLYLEPGSFIYGHDDINKYVRAKRGCPWEITAEECVLLRKETDPAPEYLGGINACHALVLGDGIEDSGVIGYGTLDCRRGFDFGYEPEKGRPYLVLFSDSKNIAIKDVTLRNPGVFTIYLICSTDIIVSGIRIFSKKCINGDGIDINSSSNITISNCILDTLDDAIGLKTLEPDHPCENVTVSGCIIDADWGAVRVGPESCGAFRNISVTNCVIKRANDGFKFQVCEDYDMEDIVCSNIVMENVMRPFFLTSNSFKFSRHSKGSRPHGGRLRRIKFADMTVKSCECDKEGFHHVDGCMINAMPGNLIEDVSFDNIHFVMTGSGKEESITTPELLDYTEGYPEFLYNMKDYPSYAMYVNNAKNVRFRDCTFEAVESDVRCAVAIENVSGFKMIDCEERNGKGLLRHHNVSDIRLDGNSGDIFTLSEEQSEQWEKFRKVSLQVAEDKKNNATVFDHATGGDVVAMMDLSQRTFKIDDPCGSYYMIIYNVTSNLEIKLNGVTVISTDYTSEYIFRSVLACDISGAIKEGTNSISVSGYDQDSSPSKIIIMKK